MLLGVFFKTMPSKKWGVAKVKGSKPEQCHAFQLLLDIANAATHILSGLTSALWRRKVLRRCSPLTPAGQGGGRVVMLTISHSDHSARSSSVAYNHYSMLATIQDGWNLGCLGFTCDIVNVQPMADLVGPKKWIATRCFSMKFFFA